MTNFKGQIETAQARQNRILSLIETRKDMRDVRCVWVADYKVGFKRLLREDTGEQIDQQPLTEKERQLDFKI